MNTRIVGACLIAGALLLPAMSYSADSDTDRKSPKAFVKDSVITTKIKAKLAKEKMSSMVNISVDTDNMGVVSLNGTARTQADIDKAVKLAKGVKGVKSVQNNIQVKADNK